MFAFRGNTTRRRYYALVLAAILGLFCAWWGIYWLAWFPQAYFPGPLDVVFAGYAMFSEGGFAADVTASALRIGAAFGVSALLAIPLGLAMSSFRVFEGVAEPVVDFIRYVPVPALVPIFVLWTGIGETPKFLVLFFGTFFQLVLLVKDDADHVPQAYFDLARTLGADTFSLLRDVLVPYLMPQIYDRLRVTLGWCWTYLIIAELVAVDRGIGHVLKEAQRFNAADRMFACFIVLGLIGLASDYAAKAGYVRLFPYSQKPGARLGVQP